MSNCDILAHLKEQEQIIESEKGFKKAIEQRFEWVSPKLLNVLQRMLEFNPKNRITAAEALALDLFDGIRVPEYEKPCSKPIQWLHEVLQPEALNYDTGKFN